MERISQIEQRDDEEFYKVRDVIRFDGEKYVLAQGFSEGIIKEMSKHLSSEEVKHLYANFYIQDK